MINIDNPGTSTTCTIVAKPNNSMTRLAMVYMMLVASMIAMMIAFAFAMVGAWPVILFTIATLIALSAGFQSVWNHAGDYECVIIHADKLHIVIQEQGQKLQSELNAYWVQVIQDHLPGGYCHKLALRSHGKEIALGRHMSSEERVTVAKLLQSKLNTLRT